LAERNLQKGMDAKVTIEVPGFGLNGEALEFLRIASDQEKDIGMIVSLLFLYPFPVSRKLRLEEAAKRSVSLHGVAMERSRLR
jgi:hypothetical protein